MIGTIDITVNSQHPNVPLSPVFSWRGSASRINVEGVPSLCGSWYVASVSIAVATPDGKTTTYPCARTCNGIYSTTIAATDTPGKTANGITITATDEEGKDFVLGRGDLYILDGAAIPAPGDVSWTVRLLSSKPENPKEGDSYFAEDGTLMVYSGGSWRNTMPSAIVPTKVSEFENDAGYIAKSDGPVLLVEDVNRAKTAVTIGGRKSDGTVGENSLANGRSVTASGDYSHAEGTSTTASGLYSHAEGSETKAEGFGSHAEGSGTTASGDYSHTEGFKAQTKPDDKYAYSWNGEETRAEPYSSHGKGTFNVNPEGGLSGFYVGEQKLSDVMAKKTDLDALAAKVDAANAALEDVA